MKSFIYIITAALAAAMFTSCESSNPYDQTVFRLEDGPRPGSAGNRYGYRGDSDQGSNRRARRSTNRDKPEPATTDRGETRVLRNEKKKPDARDEVADDFASGSNDVADTNTPSVEDRPEPMKDVEEKKETVKPDSSGSDKPFADPVAGKYGHVISPFAPGREVDVTGFPPGTEVRCPYTQRIFRVP